MIYEQILERFLFKFPFPYFKSELLFPMKIRKVRGTSSSNLPRLVDAWRYQIHSKSGLNQKNVQFLGALWLFVSKAKINDFKKKLRMEQIGIITFSHLQLIFLCTTFLHFLVHIPAQFHKSAICLHKNRKLLQVVHILNQRLWIMSFCAGRHTLLSKFPEL